MGFAILGVVFNHCRAIIPGGIIVRYGFMGFKLSFAVALDIFLLVSGLGCGRSLSNGNFEEHPVSSAFHFWRRRIRKILPKYIFVVTIYCLICRLANDSFSWIRAFNDFSLYTFFTKGNLTEWYIAAILVFYLLTPFFFKLLVCNRTVYWMLAGGIAVISFFLSLSKASDSFKTVNEIFITRFPVYMTGIAFSKKLDSREGVLERRRAILLLAVVLICYICNRLLNKVNEMCVERLLFWPESILICLLLADGFEKGKIPGKDFFEFLGSITLELYLTHEKTLAFFRWSDEYPQWYAWLFDAAAILIAIGVSLLIHRLFTLLEKRRQAL